MFRQLRDKRLHYRWRDNDLLELREHDIYLSWMLAKDPRQHTIEYRVPLIPKKSLEI